MMIMNIINQICLKTVKLYQVPRYKIFTRRKLRNEINSYENRLLTENIFDVTDNMIELLSTTSNEFKRDFGIILCRGCISFVIDDALIDYSPKFHRFNITYGDNYFMFAVGRSISPPNFLRKEWDILAEKILLLYAELIEEVAFELL